MNDHADSELQARAIELFAESLSQPAEQRQAWLASRVGEDRCLLKQLKRLLEAEGQSTGFLENSPELSLRPDRSGARVGAYTLIEEHALGGMSTVYRGRRNDGRFEQQVAIKVFDALHLRGDLLERFAAERRILAALEHPAIARLIDGGEFDDGTPYVVMEWVDGEPITHYCERHRLDLPARVTLFCRVCEALALAHRRGVVHRDIKPGNVLVDRSGDPKLIDFGIAKQLKADGDESNLPKTRQDQQLMTPEYASPEQVLGRPTSPSSDVYSLGVLLYQLLTGRRPYQLQGLSPADLQRLICDTVPVDPSRMVAQSRSAPPAGLGSARTLRRQLQGDPDRIVLSAMCHEPAQRYQSAASLADDLQRYLANKPVRARGASRSYRFRKFVDRHRAGVVATAAAFAILVAALALVQSQANEARAQAARAELASEFLTEMIGRADPYSEEAEPTLARALRASIPAIGERFSGQPQLEADLRYAIGYALQSLGQIPEAREQLERSLQLRSRLGDPIDLAQAHDAMGIIGWWESDFPAASAHFERALELLNGHVSERAQRRRFHLFTNWTGMLSDSGDYGLAATLARQGLQLIESPSAEIPAADQATLWSNYATTLESLDDFDGSLRAFQKSLQIREAAGAETSPDYASTLNNLAYLYLRQDRFEDAIRAQQRSVDILEQVLSENHPELFITSMNLSRMLIRAGELNRAEHYANRALSIAEVTMEPGNPRMGKALEAAALVREAQGQLNAALTLAERSRQIYLDAESINPVWLEAIEALIQRLQASAPDHPEN